jgi:hypothetical protein
MESQAWGRGSRVPRAVEEAGPRVEGPERGASHWSRGAVGVGSQPWRARALLPALCLGPAGGGSRPQQRGVLRSGPRTSSRFGSDSGARSGPCSGSRAAGAGLGMFGGRAGLTTPPRPLQGPRALRRQRRPAGGGGLRAPLRRRSRAAGRARCIRHSAGRGLGPAGRQARHFATVEGDA